ncbi:hypothetical protein TIFTF001_010478 [Ficus carica]|uniref:Uncharacterized protein n=1 Tax=Ficus carica TaxID=3494 RepID=A0AA87ZVJ9_FICCA|nr:hypothetical protein TIFTF001_010478 [Ficus carica]
MLPSQSHRFEFTASEVDDLIDESYFDAHLHDDDDDEIVSRVSDHVMDRDMFAEKDNGYRDDDDFYGLADDDEESEESILGIEDSVESRYLD